MFIQLYIYIYVYIYICTYIYIYIYTYIFEMFRRSAMVVSLATWFLYCQSTTFDQALAGQRWLGNPQQTREVSSKPSVWAFAVFNLTGVERCSNLCNWAFGAMNFWHWLTGTDLLEGLHVWVCLKLGLCFGTAKLHGFSVYNHLHILYKWHYFFPIPVSTVSPIFGIDPSYGLGSLARKSIAIRMDLWISRSYP